MHVAATDKWISPVIAAKISGNYTADRIRGLVDWIIRDESSIYYHLVSKRVVEQRARYSVTREFAELLKAGNL